MTVTATDGPVINFGITMSSSGAQVQANEERGPSLNDLGEGTLDPRPYFDYKPGQRVGLPVYAWPGCFGGPAVDFCPITADTSGIAATFSASAASGTVQVALQTSATSSAIRVINSFIPSSYSTPVKVLMIDGYQNSVAVGQGSTNPAWGLGTAFGTGGTINIWNPAVMGGRCFTVTSASVTDTGTVYTVNGFDIYGIAMSVKINGPGSGATVTSLRAMKYIVSSGVSFVAAGGSSVVSIGVADTFGFPLYVDNPGYVSILMGPSTSAFVQFSSTNGNHTLGYGSSLGFAGIVGNSSVVATYASSNGDTRGTWASTAPSNATAASSTTANRLVMNVSPRVWNLASITSTNTWGLVGIQQV
jgi:hypothetical protein